MEGCQKSAISVDAPVVGKVSQAFGIGLKQPVKAPMMKGAVAEFLFINPGRHIKRDCARAVYFKPAQKALARGSQSPARIIVKERQIFKFAQGPRADLKATTICKEFARGGIAIGDDIGHATAGEVCRAGHEPAKGPQSAALIQW